MASFRILVTVTSIHFWFFFQETQKKDAQLLEFLVKLSHVAPAARSAVFASDCSNRFYSATRTDVMCSHRISVDTLDADLQLLTSRTRSVQENVQEDTQLLQQLDDFLQVSHTRAHTYTEHTMSGIRFVKRQIWMTDKLLVVELSLSPSSVEC